MQTNLYKIGPKHGVKKVGNAEKGCDKVANLGYTPDESENRRLVYGSGRNEAERKRDALNTYLTTLTFDVKQLIQWPM